MADPVFQHEDGQGRPDAVSYGSVQGAIDYATLGGNDAWLALPDAKQKAALVQATRWIDATFADEWVGTPITTQQGLAWPRYGIIDPATGTEYELGWMPKQLAQATFELAYEAAKGALVRNASPNEAQLIERTVGPITRKFNPIKPADAIAERNFPLIRAILLPLLGSVAYPMRVMRV